MSNSDSTYTRAMYEHIEMSYGGGVVYEPMDDELSVSFALDQGTCVVDDGLSEGEKWDGLRVERVEGCVKW